MDFRQPHPGNGILKGFSKTRCSHVVKTVSVCETGSKRGLASGAPTSTFNLARPFTHASVYGLPPM